MEPLADNESLPVSADLDHLAHDRELTRKIMKKRQEELARRAKLQDPRRRQFGVNHAVLDQQVAERKAALQVEKDEDQSYVQHLISQEKVLQTIEGIKNEVQRQRQKETIEYSLENHHKGTRREFTLNDSKAYTSAYLTHPEDQLGPCSMSRFQGERQDPQVLRQKRRDVGSWLKVQMQEKLDREQSAKDFDQFYDGKLVEASRVCGHCEQAALEQTREVKLAEAQSNIDLANARCNRETREKQRQDKERLQHMNTIKNGGFVGSEDVDYKVGCTGKLMKGEYRRITVEQEANVYNSNAILVREKFKQEKLELEEKAAEHKLKMDGVTVLGAIEKENTRQQKARAMQAVAENQRLAEEKRRNDKKERRAYLSFDYVR